MLSIKLICSLLCLVSWTAAVPEMDCYRHGLEVVQYNHRERFTINLAAGSPNRNLRNYECTCNGYSEGCDRLDCRIVSPEEANDNDYETISMEDDHQDPEEEQSVTISIQEEQPVLSLQRENDKFNRALESENPTDFCFDSDTGDSYPRGMTYVKPGKPAMGCRCIPQGPPEIVCTELRCQLKPAANLPLPNDMDFRNCFDHWMNKVYPNGARYIRTRPMSEYQSVTGNYSCTCSYGMTKCTATDIPCCDAETGEFKAKGQPVGIDYRGTMMTCTCFGGRSSFRNCQFRRSTIPSTRTSNPVPVAVVPATASRTPTSLHGGNSSGGRNSGSSRSAPKCYDPTTSQRYLEGETWYRFDSIGNRKRCRCRRSAKYGYLQSVCKVVPL